MRGSTRMRYGKNQKRPTVLCIILSMLFTSPVFLSGISYAQTQTFVMGNYTYSGKPQQVMVQIPFPIPLAAPSILAGRQHWLPLMS